MSQVKMEGSKMHIFQVRQLSLMNIVKSKISKIWQPVNKAKLTRLIKNIKNQQLLSSYGDSYVVYS